MQNVSDEERTIKVGEMKMNLDPKEICKELPIEFA
jgi:casein kinase I family protein HRR25